MRVLTLLALFAQLVASIYLILIAGEYLCFATNEVDADERRVALRTELSERELAPAVRLEPEGPTAGAAVGQAFHVVCRAEPHSAADEARRAALSRVRLADLRWERIDASFNSPFRTFRVDENTLRLEFAPFEPHSEGDYACVATNSENKTFSQTIAIREQRLSVSLHSRLLPLRIPYSVFGAERHTATATATTPLLCFCFCCALSAAHNPQLSVERARRIESAGHAAVRGGRRAGAGRAVARTADEQCERERDACRRCHSAHRRVPIPRRGCAHCFYSFSFYMHMYSMCYTSPSASGTLCIRGILLTDGKIYEQKSKLEFVNFFCENSLY